MVHVPVVPTSAKTASQHVRNITLSIHYSTVGKWMEYSSLSGAKSYVAEFKTQY